MKEYPSPDSGDRGYWRVSATIWATENQANGIADQSRRLLCPDPTHAPPCPIPWEITIEPVDDNDESLSSLQAQVTAESNLSPEPLVAPPDSPADERRTN